jgi:UDP-N-acetyl-D-mannosaminuronate dehydrogenase
MPTILGSSTYSDPDPPVLRPVSGWPRHIARRAEQLLMRSGRSLREASVLLVGVGIGSPAHRPAQPSGSGEREAPAAEIIARLRAEEVRVDYYDPLVPALRVDGEELRSVRIELRGEGPNIGRGPSVNVKGYDLVILAALHPGYDYAWVQRCSAVLDCTYSMPGGRRRFLP